MTTISVSPEVMNQKDLVAIPREEYERLLRVAERPSQVKMLGERLAIARAEEDTLGLDESLNISLREARAGKLYGPFKSARAFMKSLRTKR